MPLRRNAAPDIELAVPSLLILDDDDDTCKLLSDALTQPGRDVRLALGPDEAFAALRQRPCDVLLTDFDLRSTQNGLDVLRAVKVEWPETQVILMSGYSTLESAVAGVRAGAFDYLAKPFDIREARSCVDRAFATHQPVETLPLGGAALPAGLVGRTREMLDVYKQIALAADAATAVLVIGESGTGKELVARAIHEYGRGNARPFVGVNCGALAETLLESELFGHVRGSFTGAVADKKGLFEQASGGTIFLDEISETSPAMQVKLLRVLQENEVRPVGGNRVIQTSARVLSASNRDLTEEVAEKRFRQDLYYRLSTFVIRLPPLRSRRDDIPMLAAQFLRSACVSAQREAQITPGAMEALAAYPWPGNVRELENVVERLVLTSRSGRIEQSDVDASLAPADPPRRGTPAFSDLPSLDELEGRYLAHVLSVTGGHRTRAAEIMKVDRKTLTRMAARHGLDGD